MGQQQSQVKASPLSSTGLEAPLLARHGDIDMEQLGREDLLLGDDDDEEEDLEEERLSASGTGTHSSSLTLTRRSRRKQQGSHSRRDVDSTDRTSWTGTEFTAESVELEPGIVDPSDLVVQGRDSRMVTLLRCCFVFVFSIRSQRLESNLVGLD